MFRPRDAVASGALFAASMIRAASEMIAKPLLARFRDLMHLSCRRAV